MAKPEARMTNDEKDLARLRDDLAAAVEREAAALAENARLKADLQAAVTVKEEALKQMRAGMAVRANPEAMVVTAAGTPRLCLLQVPLMDAVEGAYVSRRCDTDLTRSESILCRRIKDGIEARGKQCAGPAAVFKHLLGRVMEIEEAAKPKT